MKSNITKKLIWYFTAALLVFAVIIGVVFTILFADNMEQHNKNDLQRRADTIALTLSEFLEGGSLSGDNQGQGHGKGNGQGGFGVFLKLADDIAMGEVWLVDMENNLIQGNHEASIPYSELPEDGEILIQNALQGETGYSESFSEIIGTKSITVCVPAYGSNGAVLAAVLLHAPTEGVEESITSGLWVLGLSVCIALTLSVLLAVLLSNRFIQPIKRMNQAAKKMAEGDYKQKMQLGQTDEIGQLAHTLDELSERLLIAQTQQERLEKERQEFYGDISHELRTPVTVIRGSLETLRDGKIQSEEKKLKYYDQMITEAQYMQNMVNDLLDFSKLKNPDFVLETEPVNLSDIVSDAVRGMRRIAEQKQVIIQLDNPFSYIEIMGDYAKLRKMFLIVLDNAVKFSSEKQAVKVEVCGENQGYKVCITDHGPGIAPEELPHIFQRFYKDKSVTNQSGTGIGLSIAKQIADRHKINIVVDSKVNQGTCFSFVF